MARQGGATAQPHGTAHASPGPRTTTSATGAPQSGHVSPSLITSTSPPVADECRASPRRAASAPLQSRSSSAGSSSVTGRLDGASSVDCVVRSFEGTSAADLGATACPGSADLASVSRFDAFARRDAIVRFVGFARSDAIVRFAGFARPDAFVRFDAFVRDVYDSPFCSGAWLRLHSWVGSHVSGVPAPVTRSGVSDVTASRCWRPLSLSSSQEIWGYGHSATHLEFRNGSILTLVTN